MGKALMVNGSPGVSLTRNLTRFFACANAAPSAETTEANAQLTQRTPGTYSKLYIRVDENGLDDPTETHPSVFQFRIQPSGGGAGDGSQVITIPALETGEFVLDVPAATDHVNAGDKICFSLHAGNATSSGSVIAVTIMGILFEPDDGTTVVRHAATGFTSLIDETYYAAPSDYMGAGAQMTETLTQFKVSAPGTIRNLQAKAKTNLSTSGDTVITLRKNGGPQAETVSIPPGNTANVYEDLVHSFAVEPGDLIDTMMVFSNGGYVTLAIVSFEFVSAAGQFQTVYASTRDGIGPQNFNTIRCIPIGGGGLLETVEENIWTKMQIVGTASNVGFYVAANTLAP